MRKVPELFCLLLFVSLISGCFVVVMNRHFRGEKREFSTIYGDWRVGTPLAEALGDSYNKANWGSQMFFLWIPFKYGNIRWPDPSPINYAFENGYIRVDSLRVRFLKHGETIIRHHIGQGDISPQGLFGYDNDYICAWVGGLLIPADEDSIEVEFTVVIKDSTNVLLSEREFSYRLHRREGKKLALDVGP